MVAKLESVYGQGKYCKLGCLMGDVVSMSGDQTMDVGIDPALRRIELEGNLPFEAAN